MKLKYKSLSIFFEFVLNLYLSNLRSDRAWGLSFFKFKVMNFFSFHLEVMNYLSPSFLFSLELWTIFLLLFFFVGSYELSPSFLFTMKLWTISFFSCSYEVMNYLLLFLFVWSYELISPYFDTKSLTRKSSHTNHLLRQKKNSEWKKKYHFYWHKNFFFLLFK